MKCNSGLKLDKGPFKKYLTCDGGKSLTKKVTLGGGAVKKKFLTNSKLNCII